MDLYFRKTRRPDSVGPVKKRSSSINSTPLAPDEPIINNKKFKSTIFARPEPLQKSKPKIQSGPLAGISTSLLDHIRAKESAKKQSPEEARQKELLGLAPRVARIVPTIFIANKKDVMSFDRVIEKCVKSLGSHYTFSTIVECMDLMEQIAPEWVSIVNISRGKYIRYNKDRYTIPQLLSAVAQKSSLNSRIATDTMPDKKESSGAFNRTNTATTTTIIKNNNNNDGNKQSTAGGGRSHPTL